MAAEAGHKVRLLKISNHITHDAHFEKRFKMCGGVLIRDILKKGRTLTTLGLCELTYEKLLYVIEKTILVEQNSVEFI
jgi:opine dehydrogenase